MSYKYEYRAEGEAKIIQEYQSGFHGFYDLCRIYGMKQQTLEDWIRLYETFGMEELRIYRTKQKMTKLYEYGIIAT
ncbi:MAG: helix-turn-helix domain-containing protein [Christensenellales bacterium]|jgi:transposase